MATEEIQYKVSIDSSDLQSQLLGIQSNISGMMQSMIQPIQATVDASMAVTGGIGRMYADVSGAIMPGHAPGSAPSNLAVGPGGFSYAPSTFDAVIGSVGLASSGVGMTNMERTAMSQQILTEKALDMASGAAVGVMHGGSVVGGGIAGMAAGSAIGGAIVPGVGNIVGGLVGAVAGSGIGESISNTVEEAIFSQINAAKSNEAFLGATSQRFVTALGADPGQRAVFGAGLSQGELGDVSMSIARMDLANRDLNAGDFQTILQRGVQSGMFTGSSNAADIESTLGEIVETLRSASRTFRMNVDQTMQEMGGMRSAGVFNLGDMEAVSFQRRAVADISGFSPSEVGAIGTLGSQQALSSGLAGGPGMAMAERALGLVSQAEQLGMVSPEVMQMAGGQQRMALTMSQVSNNLITSNTGMTVMAAAMNADATGLNQDVVNAFITGDMSMEQVQSLAAQNLSDPSRALAFSANQQTKLAPAMQSEAGMAFMASFAMKQAEQLANTMMDSPTDADIRNSAISIMQSQFGITGAQATTALASLDPALSQNVDAQMRLTADRTLGDMSRDSGFLSDAKSFFEEAVSTPAFALANLRNSVSSALEDELDLWGYGTGGGGGTESGYPYSGNVSSPEARIPLNERALSEEQKQIVNRRIKKFEEREKNKTASTLFRRGEGFFGSTEGFYSDSVRSSDMQRVGTALGKKGREVTLGDIDNLRDKISLSSKRALNIDEVSDEYKNIAGSSSVQSLSERMLSGENIITMQLIEAGAKSVGTSIDDFMSDPSRVDNFLAAVNKSYTGENNLGSLVTDPRVISENSREFISGAKKGASAGMVEDAFERAGNIAEKRFSKLGIDVVSDPGEGFTLQRESGGYTRTINAEEYLKMSEELEIAKRNKGESTWIPSASDLSEPMRERMRRFTGSDSATTEFLRQSEGSGLDEIAVEISKFQERSETGTELKRESDLDSRYSDTSRTQGPSGSGKAMDAGALQTFFENQSALLAALTEKLNQQ